MQKRIFFLLFLIISFGTFSFAQTGKITGKVINSKTGEPMIGVTITLKGTKKGAQSDLNGNYSISGLSTGTYTLECSYISFATKSIPDIKVINGEVTTQEVIMSEGKASLDAVVVKSVRANKASVSALVLAQKNSSNVSDGISAETIKKTPDKNTSDILKRVSGTSVQEDKFVIVRGLNDRYNATFLNGAPMPSTEADRKAFSFEVFPANMIDNLVIYKTATPDIPAEFAGGAIFVNTKDIPSQNFQNIVIGTGVNTSSTFKERKYYDGSGGDFLGFDNGYRALPRTMPSAENFPVNPIQRPDLGKLLTNDWTIYTAKAMPNINLQYVRGLNIQKNQKDFIGMLFALSFSHSYNNSFGIRKEHQALGNDTTSASLSFNENVYNVSSLMGILANFSVKLNSNNTISLKNIINTNSEDRVIMIDGKTLDIPAYRGTTLEFKSNALIANQLNGDHYFKMSKIRLNWLASYALVHRNVPNRRNTVYYKSDLSDSNYIASIAFNIVPTNGNGGSIYYSYLKENTKNIKVDAQRTFKTGSSIQTLFKTGVYLQTRDRDFQSRYLGFEGYSDPNRNIAFDGNLTSFPQSLLYTPDNIGKLANGKGGLVLGEIYNPTNRYVASTRLYAAYGLLDHRFGKWVRLIWGGRVEDFTVKLTSGSDDINRRVVDFLPSANLIFSIDKKQNLRFSYSKTLNRPEFRELVPTKFFDFDTRYVINGDTANVRCEIENFDARYEIYPGKGQLLTISGFYKKFTNPIEVSTNENSDHEAAYYNALGATNKGIEVEFRTILGSLLNCNDKSILHNFSVFSNVSFINSLINAKRLASDTSVSRDRPLQGQSPYIFNGGIIYQDDKSGWSATGVINRVGQRIFIVGNKVDADIWENGRTVIDFQLAKVYPKNNLEFKLNIKDLLAQKQIFFEDNNNDQKYTEGKDYIRWNRSFGRIISFSMSYKF